MYYLICFFVVGSYCTTGTGPTLKLPMARMRHLLVL